MSVYEELRREISRQSIAELEEALGAGKDLLARRGLDIEGGWTLLGLTREQFEDIQSDIEAELQRRRSDR